MEKLNCECNCKNGAKHKEFEEILQKYTNDKSNLIQILNEFKKNMVIYLKMHKKKFQNI